MLYIINLYIKSLRLKIINFLNNKYKFKFVLSFIINKYYKNLFLYYFYYYSFNSYF